jgi:pimeloyl-ACP methyl ester carboxylesterase
MLVGHSSSGAVITGVADRAPERIAHVVYLDAFVPDDGQAVFDLVTPDRRQTLERLVESEGQGWLLPRFAPPPWNTIVRDLWGVTDHDDVRSRRPADDTPVLTENPRVHTLRARSSPHRPYERHGLAVRSRAPGNGGRRSVT